MKWTESKVTKLFITQVPKIDPISVFLENFGNGQGKLTIEVFGEAWSNYWPSMGDGWTIEKFILKTDNHYLSKKLATLAALSVPDYEGFILEAKKRCISERREQLTSKDEARRIWSNIDNIEPEKHYFDQESNYENLREVAGDEWYDSIPTIDSPLYNQLCLILDAIKQCLKERQQQQGQRQEVTVAKGTVVIGPSSVGRSATLSSMRISEHLKLLDKRLPRISIEDPVESIFSRPS